MTLVLDTANPAFYIKDYKNYGKALRANYKIRPFEDEGVYWKRVLNEIQLNEGKEMNDGENVEQMVPVEKKQPGTPVDPDQGFEKEQEDKAW